MKINLHHVSATSGCSVWRAQVNLIIAEASHCWAGHGVGRLRSLLLPLSRTSERSILRTRVSEAHYLDGRSTVGAMQIDKSHFTVKRVCRVVPEFSCTAPH